MKRLDLRVLSGGLTLFLDWIQSKTVSIFLGQWHLDWDLGMSVHEEVPELRHRWASKKRKVERWKPERKIRVPRLAEQEEVVFISLGCRGAWKDFGFYLKSSRKLPQHSKSNQISWAAVRKGLVGMRARSQYRGQHGSAAVWMTQPF